MEAPTVPRGVATSPDHGEPAAARPSLGGRLTVPAFSRFSHSVCRVCSRGWPAPRNIRYMHVHTGSIDIHHHTKDCVVAFLSAEAGGREAPSIHPDVFRRITYAVPPGWDTLTRKKEGNLVMAFHYDKHTGRISFGEKRQQDAYARLVTLNSWWIQLHKAVLQVGIGMFDLTTTISFVVALMSDKELEREFPNARWGFVLTWSLLMLVVLGICVDEASKEWRMRSHPRIGDITVLPSWWACTQSFAALITFVFFGMETIVRDIVISLHPWKGVQPFAAIKFEGTRAYVLGYDSDEHFVIWNWCGQQKVLLAKLLAQLAILCWKGLMLHFSMGHSLTLAWNCSSSSLSLLLAIRKWHMLHRARAMYRKSHPEAFKKAQASSGSRLSWKVSEGGHAEQEHFDAQKEQVNWREQAFIMRNFAGVGQSFNTQAEKSQDVCYGCRRKPSAIQMEHIEVTLQRGDIVRLADHVLHNTELYTDARHGPLKDESVGEVLEVGGYSIGHGCRVKVKSLGLHDHDMDTASAHAATISQEVLALKKHGSSLTLRAGPGTQASWWYDAAALEKIDHQVCTSKTERMEALPACDTDALEDERPAQESQKEKGKAYSADFSQRLAYRGYSCELYRGDSADIFGDLDCPLDDREPTPTLLPPTDKMPLSSAANLLARWSAEFERRAQEISERLQAEHDKELEKAVKHIFREQVGPSLLSAAEMLAPNKVVKVSAATQTPPSSRSLLEQSPRLDSNMEASERRRAESMEYEAAFKPSRMVSGMSSSQGRAITTSKGIAISSSMGKSPKLSDDEVEYFKSNMQAATTFGSKSIPSPTIMRSPDISPTRMPSSSTGRGSRSHQDALWGQIKYREGYSDQHLGSRVEYTPSSVGGASLAMKPPMVSPVSPQETMFV